IKSLRKIACVTRARTCRSNSKLPPKYFSSVRTEMASASLFAYMSAISRGDCVMSTPSEGDFGFISAISTFSELKSSRNGLFTLLAASASFLSISSGLAARDRSISSRFAATISSKTFIKSVYSHYRTMTRVKICGIKNIEDARSAAALGADELGFHIDLKGGRSPLTREVARAFISQLPEDVASVIVTSLVGPSEL